VARAQQPVVKRTEKVPRYDLVSADYGPVECGKKPKLVKHISIVPEWCMVQKVGDGKDTAGKIYCGKRILRETYERCSGRSV